MPEHRIRLRGGWELREPDSASSGPTPLTLPIAWAPHPSPRRLRLVRKFGAPAADRVQLALEAVEGLRAMTLNGAPLAFEATATDRLVVDLPPLTERNVLTLDVERAGPSTEPSAPWGRIALVIAE